MTTAPEHYNSHLARAGHSTLREGAIAGGLAALLVWLWYLLLDARAGRALHTPNVLGRLLTTGSAQTIERMDAGAIASYTALHFIGFGLLGMALIGLVHLTVRDIRLRMGLWLGLVIGFVLLNWIMLFISQVTGERLPWWWGFGASTLGLGSIVIYAWRRHPQLGRSLRRVPLADEVGTPEHAPDARTRRR
jgi:hypothetical protein